MKTKNEICISDLNQKKQYSYEKPECEVVLLNTEGLICTSGGEGVEMNATINDYYFSNDQTYSGTLEW